MLSGPPLMGTHTQTPPAGDSTRRFDTKGRTLRQHAARGTIINAVYMASVNSLGLLRGFVVAAFLTATDYGIWGILMIGVGALYWFKDVGISDKYVQQSEADQELAFQKAFTLEVMLTGGFTTIVAALVPLVALAYGHWEIVPPAYALLLAVPAQTLQAPLWVHYRNMDFLRQRRLQAIDPVVGFVATVALAVAGLGYWSLVVGTVAGAWAAAAACVYASPFRFRFRYDRGTMREYVRFSWPLLVGNATRFITVQAYILVGTRSIGLAATGAITLASQIANYTNRVDMILAETLYPAICAVKDRLDLMFESFVKSNRLALMWGVPFGVGMSLFSADLVHFAIGDRWEGAILVLQTFGLLAAVNHLAYNWDDYFRARGETKPVAKWGAINLTVTLGVTIPLMLWQGLDGYAVGMAIGTLVSVAGRFYFLTRLFDGLAMLSHCARAVAPTVPAALAVLALRLVEPGHRSPGLALAELGLFMVVVVLTTAALERSLLREVIGYLRRVPAARPEVAS